MAVRAIIRIDEEKCDGCGDCVSACHEGAIQIIDGKARLISETYCDGLGACIGDCPLGAITIEHREAASFDEAAVKQHLESVKESSPIPLYVHSGGGCPGSASRVFDLPTEAVSHTDQTAISRLSHWPIQLMLVPPQAPYLRGADLLICADCVPFAYPDFHERFLAGRRLLVGCPKLDNLDYYREKLADIFAIAQPRSITVVKMEVPCCYGIAAATVEARDEEAATTPIEIVTIGIQGQLLDKQRMAV